MSVSSISGSLASSVSAASTKKADESIEQLAAEGDPTAIAELKLEQQLETPKQASGPSEPGKGGSVDTYV